MFTFGVNKIRDGDVSGACYTYMKDDKCTQMLVEKLKREEIIWKA
jgi:hypothetical protein